MDDRLLRAFGVSCEITMFSPEMVILLSMALMVCRIAISTTLLGESAAWGHWTHGILVDAHRVHRRAVIRSCPFWQYSSTCCTSPGLCIRAFSNRLMGQNTLDGAQDSCDVVLCQSLAFP